MSAQCGQFVTGGRTPAADLEQAGTDAVADEIARLAALRRDVLAVQ